MGIKMCSGTIKTPTFTTTVDSEFTTLMQCEIAGIQKEDVKFEYKNNEYYDDENEFALLISGFSKNKYIDHDNITFNIQLAIDKKEYYGYDYFIDDGILTLILYKTRKNDIGLFDKEPKIKYIRKPMMMI